MPDVRFDTFYRYDDLTAILRSWATERPELVALESIGPSYEGREIWLVTLTSSATGPHAEKPAFWLDANIHATEVTGSTAALHLIHTLVEGFGRDERVTRALETRAFYIVPRLNPDGAELALAERPRFIRSSTRPYPRRDRQDGLHEEDIDGDGRILCMRIPDPNGIWKAQPDEPRLLVERAPDEVEGSFYRLLIEGLIQGYDGATIAVAPDLQGLDLNRQFPMEWTSEDEQRGAGPYPVSEPEARACVQAIVDRPNICGGITYHTFSGVHLRPYSAHDDDHFPTADLRVFKRIGEHATRITGYPAVSVYHDFRYEPKQTIKGGWDDWMYEQLGVYAWTTEFWSPQRQAGITRDYHLIEWDRDHPLEDDLALLRWSDNELGGRGYVDWYPFDHPQLGPVELGGWDSMLCWSNVPPHLLEREIAPHSELALFHALISPQLALRSAEATAVGDGVFAIRVVVENRGWLPTAVTQKAVDRKAVRPLEIELVLPEGARLVGGERRVEAGQLAGRAHRRTIHDDWAGDPTLDRAKADWVVAAPDGGVVRVEARHQRAGTVRCELRLAG